MELLESCVARIKTITALAERAAGIVELEQIANGALVIPVPYAYVLLLSETTQPDEMITIVAQKVSAAFGVVLSVSNTVTPMGLKGIGEASDLRTLRTSIRDKLLGWQPNADYHPVTYVGGRLVKVDKAVLWWQDEYVSDYYIRSV